MPSGLSRGRHTESVFALSLTENVEVAPGGISSAHISAFPLTSAHATLIPVILSVLSVILSVSEESVASNRLFAPDPSLRLRLRSG